MKLYPGNLVVREAGPQDAAGIVALFTEEGTNPYGWCEQKWRHYYLGYPCGEGVALVAEAGGKIVGHYGMLPVRIGIHPAMLGLHAYVSASFRGLAVISALMAEVDGYCKAHGVSVICGFANPKFSLVKKTLFGWQVPLWLGFKQATPTDTRRGDAPFYFHYPESWYRWRFGEERSIYLSRFVDQEGTVRKQLLKTRGSDWDPETLSGSECWSRSAIYPCQKEGEFRQPFSVKLYDTSLLGEGILEQENWFLEMGDSDTFSYTPWSTGT